MSVEISRKLPGCFLNISRNFSEKIWKFPWNLPETSRKCPGHFLEISWKCPWKSPGNFPESFQKIIGNFHGNLPEISRKFPETFLDIFLEISRKSPENFLESFRKFLENFHGHLPEVSRKRPGNFPDFSRMFPNMSRKLPGHFPEFSQKFTEHVPEHFPKSSRGSGCWLLEPGFWRHGRHARLFGQGFLALEKTAGGGDGNIVLQVYWDEEIHFYRSIGPEKISCTGLLRRRQTALCKVPCNSKYTHPMHWIRKDHISLRVWIS